MIDFQSKKKKKKPFETPASNISSVAQISEEVSEISKTMPMVVVETSSANLISTPKDIQTKEAKKALKKQRKKAAAKGADDVDIRYLEQLSKEYVHLAMIHLSTEN